MLPPPTIIDDDAVDEAEDSSDGEQVGPSEWGPPGPSLFIIEPDESSRFIVAAFGAFRRTCIHGKVWLPGGVG